MESILIVDDEPTIREIFKTLLEEKGYTTLQVTNGEDAVKVVEGMNVDVAIVDLKMDGIDGIETIKQLRIIKPDLMIIMTTALIPGVKEEGSLTTALLSLGVTLLLEKPFCFSTFPTNVGLLLNARRIDRLKNFG